MRHGWRLIILSILFVSLIGCGSGFGIYHRVREGESFDMICRAYGVDGNAVARANGIEDTSKVKPGDAIWIPGASRVLDVKRSAPPVTGGGRSGGQTAKKAPARSTDAARRAPLKGIALVWPVAGEVVSTFGTDGDEIHDGIDISAEAGTEIRAAAAGRVIYSGDEIKGYGNMVIIRHDGNYSTVYAHNQKNLVKKGDYVEKGQPIALAGSSGRSDITGLHFEVRRGKEAVDPLLFLP